MGYPQDLDEYTTDQLTQELSKRKQKHRHGICSYCTRDHNKPPACKFPRRHSGLEV